MVKPLVDQSFRPWATAPVWRGVAYPRGIVPYLALQYKAVAMSLQVLTGNTGPTGFFTDPAGWVGHFTGTDIARRFPYYEPEGSASRAA